jgi:hypothetical protein
VDPDSEVITAAEVSPATSGDAAVAPRLLDDLTPAQDGGPATRAVVDGDSAYGTGTNLAWLDRHGLTPMVKTQLPTAPGGRFAKDQFRIDLQAGTLTCPARVTTAILPASRGGGRARFGAACSVCPLRSACTSSVGGRVVAIHPQGAELAAARARQRDPAWLADCHPAQGRTQARALAPSPSRWPARPGARPGPGCQGFQAAGRRGQPGPLGHPGRAPHQRRLAGPAGLTGRRATDCGRPPNTQNSYSPSENTGHLALPTARLSSAATAPR